MATHPSQPLQFPKPKKAFIRRFAPDHSQRARHIVQGLFLLLNGWLGLQSTFGPDTLSAAARACSFHGLRELKVGFPSQA